MVLEYYKKETEKIEEKDKPTPQPTLKDTLQDKEKSALFGKLLDAEGEHDLAERMAKGELSDGDINNLEERRTTFADIMERVDSVKKMTTKENVESIARNNPEFQKILNLVGPESAVKIFQKRMADISISDPYRFNKIADSMNAVQEYKDGYFADLNKEVKEMSKKYGISEQKYAAALAIEDEAERTKAIQELVKGTRTKWNKVTDFFNGGKTIKNRAELMSSKKEEIEEAFSMLRTHQANIGEVLADTVEGNEEVRKMLALELNGDKTVVEKQKVGFSEMMKEKPGEEVYDKEWNDYKKGFKDWDKMPADKKEEAVDTFIEKIMTAFNEKNKGKEGFWMQMMKMFAEFALTNKRSSFN